MAETKKLMNIPDLSVPKNLIADVQNKYSRGNTLPIKITNREFIPIQSLNISFSSNSYSTISTVVNGATNPFFRSFLAYFSNNIRTNAHSERMKIEKETFKIWKKHCMAWDKDFVIRVLYPKGNYDIHRVTPVNALRDALGSMYNSPILRVRTARSKLHPELITFVLGYHSLILQGDNYNWQLDAARVFVSGDHPLKFAMFKAVFMGSIRRSHLHLFTQETIDDITAEQLQEAVVLLVDRDFMNREYGKTTGTGRALTEYVGAYLSAGYEVHIVDDLWGYMTRNEDFSTLWKMNPKIAKRFLERNIHNKLLKKYEEKFVKTNKEVFETTI